MGWMCSWVGVQTTDREALLNALGMVEAGDDVEPGSRSSDWSIGELPGGWLIVFSEGFEWGSPERARELSAFGRAVSLQFEDKVDMTSVACEARDGVELWRVSHSAEEEDLEITGEPPPGFESIRDRLSQDQEEEDGESVDYLHDIPIEVAKSVCGYRADDWIPPFAALRQVRPSPAAGPAAPGGLGRFLKGLFGR